MKTAITALKTNLSDAKANGVVGQYYCFTKGEWKEGLPFLASGDDPQLKALAEKEGEKLSEPLALGDGWWKVAEGLDGRGKLSVQQRAAGHYRRALPKLEGFAKTRVEKRLASVAPQGNDSKPEIDAYTRLLPPRKYSAVLAQDKHSGETGSPNNTSGNVYTLQLPSPSFINGTRIRFQSENRSPDNPDAVSNGDILVSLDGGDWIKVTEWTKATYLESRKHGKWSEFTLQGFKSVQEGVPDRRRTVRKIRVKFQYTGGGDAFKLYHVFWIR